MKIEEEKRCAWRVLYCNRRLLISMGWIRSPKLKIWSQISEVRHWYLKLDIGSWIYAGLTKKHDMWNEKAADPMNSLCVIVNWRCGSWWFKRNACTLLAPKQPTNSKLETILHCNGLRENDIYNTCFSCISRMNTHILSLRWISTPFNDSIWLSKYCAAMQYIFTNHFTTISQCYL